MGAVLIGGTEAAGGLRFAVAFTREQLYLGSIFVGSHGNLGGGRWELSVPNVPRGRGWAAHVEGTLEGVRKMLVEKVLEFIGGEPAA